MANTILPQSKPTALRLVVDNGPKHTKLAQVRQEGNEPDLVLILSSLNKIQRLAESIPNYAIQKAFSDLCDKQTQKVLCNLFGGAA